MSAVVSVDVAAVREAVTSVPDPELPTVTLGMLGMLHHLDVAVGGHVTVELLPTYSGCPALEMIERDVAAAVAAVPGVGDVTVRFRFDPPWSPARIDATGRERLRAFGIAPPGGAVGGVVGVVGAEGRATLPLLAAIGDRAGPRPCPYCGSTDTARDSVYGPTPCRDLRMCHGCGQPFEAFRE